MSKSLVSIENWSVVDDLIFHGYRNLEPGQRLTGTIFGHENLPNGVVYTSVIQSVDSVNGTVETLNTIYRLGQVNEQYERWMLAQDEARAGMQWDDVHSRFVNDAGHPGEANAGILPSPHLTFQSHHR